MNIAKHKIEAAQSKIESESTRVAGTLYANEVSIAEARLVSVEGNPQGCRL